MVEVCESVCHHRKCTSSHAPYPTAEELDQTQELSPEMDQAQGAGHKLGRTERLVALTSPDQASGPSPQASVPKRPSSENPRSVGMAASSRVLPRW